MYRDASRRSCSPRAATSTRDDSLPRRARDHLVAAGVIPRSCCEVPGIAALSIRATRTVTFSAEVQPLKGWSTPLGIAFTEYAAIQSPLLPICVPVVRFAVTCHF